MAWWRRSRDKQAPHGGGDLSSARAHLQEFVGEGIPWAHVDIAGPAFNDKGPKGHTPKGGTGFGVATLLALVESSAG